MKLYHAVVVAAGSKRVKEEDARVEETVSAAEVVVVVTPRYVPAVTLYEAMPVEVENVVQVTVPVAEIPETPWFVQDEPP